MSQATDFTSAFLAKLAGGAVNPTLQGIFAKILANQVTVDAADKADFTGSFATLAKVFTFAVATDRPASGPLGYTTAQVDAAKTAAAVETGVTVGDTTPPDVPSTIINLTNAKDDVLVGTEKNDTFIAATGNTKVTTLNDTDSIDGGAGVDTLKVELGNDFKGFNTKKEAGMTNVEIVELTNVASKKALAFDAKGTDGVETYVLNATKESGFKSITNIIDTDLTVKLNNQAKGELSLGFVKATDEAPELEPQDIKLNLELTNVGTKAIPAIGTKSGAPEVQVIIKSAGEDLTLNVTGENFVDLTEAATKTITAKGAGSLTVDGATDGGVNKDLTTFDASGVEGNVYADLKAVITDKLTSIQTGAGNDLVWVNVGGLNGNVEIDGGEGNNTLYLSGTASIAPTISNFQTLNISTTGNALEDITLAADKITDVTNLVVTTGAANHVLVADLAPVADKLTVDTSLITTSKLTLADEIGELTLNLGAAGIGTGVAGLVSAEAAASVAVNVGGHKTTAIFTPTPDVKTELGINEAAEVSFKLKANKSTEGKDVETKYTGVIKAATATTLNVDVAKDTIFAPADVSSGSDNLLVEIAEVNLTGKGTVDFTKVVKLGNLENAITINAGTTQLKVKELNASDIAIESTGNLDFVSGSTLNAAEGDINITLSGLGKLTAASGTTIEAKGNITLNLGDFKGTIAAGTSGVPHITLKAESVDLVGSRLDANLFNIIAEEVTVTGGLLDDVAIVTLDKQTTNITFDGGIGDDTLVLNTTDGNISALEGFSFDLTSVETLQIMQASSSSYTAASAFKITADQSVMLESVEKLYFGASGSASAVTIYVGNTKVADKLVSYGKEAVGTFGADAFTINTSAGVANTDVFNITNFTVNSGTTAGAVDTIVGFGSTFVVFAASGTASAKNIVSFNNTGNALSVADIQAKFDASGAASGGAMKLAASAVITFIDQVGTTATLYSVKGVTGGNAEVVTLLGTVTADDALIGANFA